MKKILFFLPLLLLSSSCIVLDANVFTVRYELSNTVWQGTYSSTYSVSFGSDGSKATFTFLDGKITRIVTASYVSEISFGSYDAALYRLDSNPWYTRYYYAFYPSLGYYLYGNLAAKPYISDFSYATAEIVAKKT